jgi:hypothetical protein
MQPNDSIAKVLTQEEREGVQLEAARVQASFDKNVQELKLGAEYSRVGWAVWQDCIENYESRIPSLAEALAEALRGEEKAE